MKRLVRLLVIAGAVVLVLYGLMLWGVLDVMMPKPQVFLETKSPDGRLTAHLERPGGGVEPIYYAVKVTGAQTCTAAEVRGLQAETWVRLAWEGETLVVRYVLPIDLNAKASAPKAKLGAEGCHGMGVRVIEDETAGASGVEPVGNGS